MPRDVVADLLEVKSRRGHFYDHVGPLRKVWVERRIELTAAADFFPIRMVTILEVFTRQWIATLIDHGDPYLENASRLNDAKAIPFDVARALLGKRVSIGELIAHSLQLNSLPQIHKAFTTVLGTDLWTAIEHTHDRRAVEVLGEELTPMVADLGKLRWSLARLIEIRHIVVHELPTPRPYSPQEIDEFFDATFSFVKATEQTLMTCLYGAYPLTTLDMTEAAAVKLGEVHAELTNVLDSMRQSLGEAARPAFDAAHDAWTRYCDAHEALVAKNFEGGTMENFFVCEALTGLTLDRTKLLREWTRGR